MEPRQLILDLVPQISRNANVVNIEETAERYRVTIAGTTGVVARCDVARDDVESALASEGARSRLAGALKRCADRTVAEVGDARG
jgi:hypothetical protein